jgi:hypothetical protein
MNEQTVKTADATALLLKADPTAPCIVVTGPQSAAAIKGGTTFGDRVFAEDTLLPEPSAGWTPGADYGVKVSADAIVVDKLTSSPNLSVYLGGFHFAPGGNAPARAGGDTTPAINPFSVWDLNFRPTCPDPRGMTLVRKPGGQFWADIYLLGADHMKGTSRFGQVIADGNDTPINPDGEEPFEKLDYDTAVAVMKHHGKGLLSFEEFVAAAYGVTEKTTIERDPKKTKLDVPRTSKFGLMQATGNLWVWGHDGDPDLPRASVFGGSWWLGDFAGSRCADVACYWPGYSSGSFGARGRSDHLQLV